MPVTEDGIGHGPLTQIKIEHLTKIFGYHLAVTQNVLRRFPTFSQHYRYVDLTAGKGFTPDGIKGSPLVFLEQVEDEKFQLPYLADFIELGEENLLELRQHVNKKASENGWKCQNLNFIHGDYEKIVPSLFSYRDTKEFGLIFVDHTGNLPNFDILKHFARNRPKMEILIYIPTTNVKRVHHITEKYLSDFLDEIGKKYWLIRKPFSRDSFKWTFLLGSNTDIFKDYKSIDFFRLDSDEAKNFFPKLNFSKRQRQDMLQPPLFDLFED